MALPSWPAELPKAPEAGTFARPELYPAPAVFEPEDGPDIERPQGQTEIERLQVSFVLTTAQYSAFKTFVKTTLVQGTSHFMMDVPIEGWACENRRVYIEMQSPAVKPVGASWRVSFTLCVLPAA
jgi:hypothetical protein